nr:efflux RND transporter periplasmic adaptor subunit [uncultured Treponema sp.]
MKTGKSSRNFLLILAIIVTSCKNEPLTKDNIKVKVETITVKKDKFDDSIKNLGTLCFKSKHNVSSLVSGRLSEIKAKVGDHVKKGQVLGILRNIQLENQKEMYENTLSEAQASLLIAEDNLRTEKLNLEKDIIKLEKLAIQIRQTEAEYEHKKKCYSNSLELYKLGGLSDLSIKEEELNLCQIKTSLDLMKKEFEINSLGFRNEDIENQGYEVPKSKKEKDELLIYINSRKALNVVKQENSRIDSCKKNLLNIENLIEELKIKSTVSGIIASCNFQIGDHVSENESCFVVFDGSNLDAVFYVQEQNVWEYRLNDRIKIAVPSLNESFETAITEISPVADPTSGNFCVKADVSNLKNELKPGMFINCSLPSKQEEYLVVPESCIVYHLSENPFVFYISENHVFSRPVKIIFRKNGLVYLESGLKENDVVIDRPSVMLKEGDPVEIQ